MSGPLRWKDDPAIRGSGIDLADEELVVGGYDLDRVRRGVEARTGGNPGPGGGSAIAGGAVAAGLGLAAMALFAVWSTPADDREILSLIDEAIAEQAAPAAPVEESEVEAVEVGEVEEVEAVPPIAPPPARLAQARPPAQDPPGPAPEPLSEDDGLAAVDPDLDAIAPMASQAVAPAPAGSQLAEELAAVQAARSALDAGDAAHALASYRAYLARWPDGHLKQEALVAVLESLVALERWDAAAQLAGRLAATPELAPRRSEMLRTRADALVRLGDCDGALGLVDGLDRPDAAAVRQRCRRAR